MSWNIADRLGPCVKAKGWTNAELSRRSGLNERHIWKILHGDRPRVEAETVRKLARALDVTTDYLLAMDMPENSVEHAAL